ncbi:hypothetical protein CHRY9390_00322 [Chryseobacterium aquaeductus]|uniref:Uncharacterized protein n=1 Tax=Chryseobacterium aquaeductus TaxID=2675056 RepID=A0A9N8QPM7_9FLAO|nr:hypothetical protein [Chryseobacterium aquaeductus]CAA7329681.1 hypothetical protein CHRY9390_00322 [Chryseobacterium potabilaquae]CAD7798343.1 hypothetical protein CHRY9390_00322 [Chryseobacterium aquaeductus]
MYKKILAGFAGAIALNILHETIRKNFDNVPEINKLGEEALLKMTDNTPINITGENNLYAATLVGDIVSNGMYYATTATKSNLTSGLLAGVGAIVLPKKMGLNENPVASNNKKKIMTVGYYVFGALVTKFVYDKIK